MNINKVILILISILVVFFAIFIGIGIYGSFQQENKESIEETIKDIESLKYEDFNKFLSKYFENTDLKFEMNNKTEINVWFYG